MGGRKKRNNKGGSGGSSQPIESGSRTSAGKTVSATEELHTAPRNATQSAFTSIEASNDPNVGQPEKSAFSEDVDFEYEQPGNSKKTVPYLSEEPNDELKVNSQRQPKHETESEDTTKTGGSYNDVKSEQVKKSNRRSSLEYYQKDNADSLLPAPGDKKRAEKRASRRRSNPDHVCAAISHALEAGQVPMEMEVNSRSLRDTDFPTEEESTSQEVLGSSISSQRKREEAEAFRKRSPQAVTGEDTEENEYDHQNISWSNGHKEVLRRPAANPHLIRLYESHVEQEEKRKRRQEQLGKEYTFTPTTNRKKQDGEKVYISPVKASERLYSLAQKAEEKRSSLVRKDSECSFRPKINAWSPTVKDKDKKTGDEKEQPVYDRLFVQAKEREARLKEKQEAIAAEQCTFKPKLSTKSYKKPSRSPEEKLSSTGSYKNHKCVDSYMKDCTFKPKINASKPLNKDSTHSVRPPPVHEKLYSQFDKLQQDRLERQKSEEAKAMKECTFRPRVNSHGSSVQQSGDAYQRLYAHATERNQRQSSPPREQYSFKPKISPITRKVLKDKEKVNTGSRWEQLYREGKLRVHERASTSSPTTELTEDDMTNCTFQPNAFENGSLRKGSFEKRYAQQLPVHERLYQHARNVQAVREATMSGGIPFVEEEITEDQESIDSQSRSDQALYLL